MGERFADLLGAHDDSLVAGTPTRATLVAVVLGSLALVVPAGAGRAWLAYAAGLALLVAALAFVRRRSRGSTDPRRPPAGSPVVHRVEYLPQPVPAPELPAIDAALRFPAPPPVPAPELPAKITPTVARMLGRLLTPDEDPSRCTVCLAERSRAHACRFDPEDL